MLNLIFENKVLIDYLVMSLIYFIIFTAIVFLRKGILTGLPDDWINKQKPKSKLFSGTAKRFIISFIPFVRFFIAILFVIATLLPEPDSLAWVKMTKKKEDENQN